MKQREPQEVIEQEVILELIEQEIDDYEVEDDVVEFNEDEDKNSSFLRIDLYKLIVPLVTNEEIFFWQY